MERELSNTYNTRGELRLGQIKTDLDALLSENSGSSTEIVKEQILLYIDDLDTPEERFAADIYVHEAQPSDISKAAALAETLNTFNSLPPEEEFEAHKHLVEDPQNKNNPLLKLDILERALEVSSAIPDDKQQAAVQWIYDAAPVGSPLRAQTKNILKNMKQPEEHNTMEYDG